MTAQENGFAEYYVASAANGGSAENSGALGSPLLTVADAVEKGITAGIGENGTVIVNINGGDTVEWGTAPDYNFKLTVKSDGDIAKITFAENQLLTGDVDFYNVELMAGGAWPTRNFYLNGKNVRFDENTVLTADYLIFGANNTSDNYESQTVEYNISKVPGYVIGGNYRENTITYQKDFNVIFNSVNSNIPFYLTGNYGTTNYNKNVNIIVKSAAALTFKNLATKWNIEGAVQIVYPQGLTITDDKLVEYPAKKGIYKIVNTTNIECPLGFVEGQAGKYKVLGDTKKYNFVITDNNGNNYNSILDEADGCYYISVPTAGEYTLYSTKVPESTTLYVKLGSTDSDGTSGKPFANIGEAIAKAVADGYSTGDTVNIIILDDGTAGSDTVSWGTQTQDYKFKAVVKSDTEVAKINFENNQLLLGDVDFYNVELMAGGAWPTRNFYLNGKNVRFDESTVLTADYLIFGANNTSDNYESQTVEYNISKVPGYVIGGNYRENTITYQKDFNVIFNSVNSNIPFYLTGNYGTTNYNKNVNIIVKSAAALTFKNLATKWNIEGAVQIVYPQGLTITDDKLVEYPAKKGIYKIVNTTNIETPLGFVDGQAGKYKVLADTVMYSFMLTDKLGNTYSMEQNREDDCYYINVPAAGEYTLTAAVKKPENDTVYVRMGATDGDGTCNKPFGNISDAVNYAKLCSYIKGESVYVIILDDGNAGGDTVTWSNITAYEFDLTIKSETEKAIISLDEGATLQGDVTFENVDVAAGGAWPGRKINFGGHNIVFGANTGINTDYIAFGKASGTSNYSSQRVQLNCKYLTSATYLYTTNEAGGVTTYGSDVEFVFNNSQSNLVVSPGANGDTTYYEENLNLNIINSASLKFIDFGSAGGWSIDGAVQLIHKENLSITDLELFNAYAPIYKIINKSGIDDALAFVPETAGKYKVLGDTENFVFTLTDTDYNTYYSALDETDGCYYITVPKAGEYTLEKIKPAVKKVYYVKSGAADGDGTAIKPFATLSEALAKASIDGLESGDTAEINILSADALEYGEPANYTYEAVIKSAYNTPISFTAGAILAGDTKFDGVVLNCAGAFHFGGHNLEMAKSVTITGATYLFTGLGNVNATFGSQRVVFHNDIGGRYLNLASDWGNTIYNGTLEVKFTNAATKARIWFGMHGNNTYTRVNLDLGSTSGTFIENESNPSFSEGINVIYNVKLNEAVKTTLDSKREAGVNVCYVNNVTGVNVLGFHRINGKYSVAESFTAVAYNAEGIKIADLQDGVLQLGVNGDYKVVCTENGDINADDEYNNNVYDIRDLVALDMYITDNDSITIKTNAADKNNDGIIDENDIYVIRKELLFGLFNKLSLGAYSNLNSNLVLTWTTESEVVGSASGTYTLKADDSSAYGTYELYYANEEGILTEYAPIAKCKVNAGNLQAQYSSMVDTNVFPVEATKVVAAIKGQIRTYMDIPKDKLFNPGELLYSHAVLSDVHVFSDKTQPYNGYDELPLAIDTVREMGAEFISITGDLTYDDGLAALKEVLEPYDDYDINVCTGNHDVNISEDDWTAYWGKAIDYSFTHNGETFIYMSLQTASSYSDEKIEWLSAEMEKASGNRIYLFMHFPIPQYAGLKPDNYYGFTETSTEDDRIMELIRQYDNTYVFSGHTHYNFDSQNDYPNITVAPIEGTNSYTVHVPSLAYPRLSNDWNMYEQSQGFFVEVYENGIVLKGIDFKQGKKLIPHGCYYLKSK